MGGYVHINADASKGQKQHLPLPGAAGAGGELWAAQWFLGAGLWFWRTVHALYRGVTSPDLTLCFEVMFLTGPERYRFFCLCLTRAWVEDVCHWAEGLDGCWISSQVLMLVWQSLYLPSPDLICFYGWISHSVGWVYHIFLIYLLNDTGLFSPLGYCE